MAGIITSNGSGSVMGTRQIIRDGLIAYWDAANYLSNPTASGGLSTAVTLPTNYEWIDMIEGNKLYVSGGTGTLATATTAANYNLGGIFKNVQGSTVTLTNRAITGSLNTNLPAVTYEVWMRITDSSGFTGYSSVGSDYGFRIYQTAPTNSYLSFFAFNTSNQVISASAIDYGPYPATSKIVHAVGTYDGQTARIYTNGDLSQYSQSFASPSNLRNNASSTDQWYFWRAINNISTYTSQGYFYIVRIYNRALSDQEVKQNYLSQAGRFLGYNINP